MIYAMSGAKILQPWNLQEKSLQQKESKGDLKEKTGVRIPCPTPIFNRAGQGCAKYAKGGL